jgi:hypothetical protein
MTTKPVANRWQRNMLGPAAICCGFFIVADLLLISRPWFLGNEPLLVAMAVPLSQCSLAALWAASSRASLYLRFAVPLVGTIAGWYVLTRILPWGIGEPASAAWALALAIQTLAIVLMVHLYDRVCSFLARRGSRGEDSTSHAHPAPFAFDLRTLMLWTTAITLVFGFVRYARTRWRWTESIADWEFLQAMPIIGAFNALVAVLWLWALASGSRQKRSIKTAAVLLLIGVLGFLMSFAVAWTTGTNAIEIHDCLVLVVAQSVFVASAIGFVLIAVRQEFGSCFLNR